MTSTSLRSRLLRGHSGTLAHATISALGYFQSDFGGRAWFDGRDDVAAVIFDNLFVVSVYVTGQNQEVRWSFAYAAVLGERTCTRSWQPMRPHSQMNSCTPSS
jgi:hypothetical protein